MGRIHAPQLMRNSRHVPVAYMMRSHVRHCQSQLRRIQSSTDVRTWAEQLRAHELRTGAAGAGTPVERTDSGRTATSDDGDGHHMRPLSMSHGPASRWVGMPEPPVIRVQHRVCCRDCCRLLHTRQNTSDASVAARRGSTGVLAPTCGQGAGRSVCRVVLVLWLGMRMCE